MGGFILNLFLLTIILLPIVITGYALVSRMTDIDRFEMLFPTSVIVGFGAVIFWLNIGLHLVGDYRGLTFGFFVNYIIGWIVLNVFRNKTKIDFSIRFGICWLGSLFITSVLVFWKASHALIGGDTAVYYSVASSIVRGNFPPVTPWQPDVLLAYHLGFFELIGFIHYFTNIEWLGIHLWITSIWILMSMQIVLWMWGRPKDWVGYLWAGIVFAITFISFGFIFVGWPSGGSLPVVRNISELVIWLRQLPSAYYSLDTYGSVTNLDSLIYVPFYSLGVSLFLGLVSIVIHTFKPINRWFMIFIGLSVLALVNEALFVGTFLGFLGVMMFLEIRLIGNKSFLELVKRLTLVCILGTICMVYSIVQGGYLTVSLYGDKAVLLLPSIQDAGFDYWQYHLNAQISRLMPYRPEWEPIRWLHIGVDALVVISCLILAFIKKKTISHQVILIALILTGVASLLIYNLFIPKYISANGNRILVFSYLVLSISVFWGTWDLIVSYFYKIRVLVVCLIVMFIVLPTVLPPMMAFSKTRFGDNKLILRKEGENAASAWIAKNIPIKERVTILDVNSPHPSGIIDIFKKVGIESPVFVGGFRTYTVEPGPEFTDVVYSLSPIALKKLGIKWIVMDREYYEKLPYFRKRQLENPQFFSLHHHNLGADERRIYKIEEDYLINGSELSGTLVEMGKIFTPKSKIYIDDESNFEPNYLRRPVIFSIRDLEIYFAPGSGVYQHAETKVNMNDPILVDKYDFIISGASTKPNNRCRCETELIWTGVGNNVFIWKVK